MSGVGFGQYTTFLLSKSDGQWAVGQCRPYVGDRGDHMQRFNNKQQKLWLDLLHPRLVYQLFDTSCNMNVAG